MANILQSREIQKKTSPTTENKSHTSTPENNTSPSQRNKILQLQSTIGNQAVIQMLSNSNMLNSEISSPSSIHKIAAAGVQGAGHKLPYYDRIQASFGDHDLSNVQAYTDSAAAKANANMGAHAYATGNKIAFAGTPSLHTAAHEAAHVIQQRAGVHLKSGVGEVGDTYERQADMVADAVSKGKSSELLLNTYSDIEVKEPQLKINLVNPVANGIRNTNIQMQKSATSYFSPPSPTPLKQIIDYLVTLTLGVSKTDIEKEAKTHLNSQGVVPNTYFTLLNADLPRPNEVKAVLDGATTKDNSRDKIITAIGKLGLLEDFLRRRKKEEYDGGHLLALNLFANWNEINTATNLAPQDSDENRSFAWRQNESYVARLINEGATVEYSTNVIYPSNGFVVDVEEVAHLLFDKNSATHKAIIANNHRGILLLTPRLPYQFHNKWKITSPPTSNKIIKGPVHHGDSEDLGKGLLSKIGNFTGISGNKKAFISDMSKAFVTTEIDKKTKLPVTRIQPGNERELFHRNPYFPRELWSEMFWEGTKLLFRQ
jgi:hypothetical protein